MIIVKVNGVPLPAPQTPSGNFILKLNKGDVVSFHAKAPNKDKFRIPSNNATLSVQQCRIN